MANRTEDRTGTTTKTVEILQAYRTRLLAELAEVERELKRVG